MVDGSDLRVATSLVPVAHASPPALPATEVVERASRTLLGVVLVVLDGVSHLVERTADEQSPPASTDEPGVVVTTRRVAVGFAFDTQRRLLDALDAAGRVIGPPTRWLTERPFVRRASAPVRRRLDAAYELGLTEEERARDVAGRSGEQAVQMAVPVVLERVDVDLLVGQLLAEVDVGVIIDRVLGQVDMKPVIDRVMGELDLPVLVENVMSELDLDPIVQRVLANLDLPSLVNEVVGEIQMSSVVMKATGGMADDVLGEVRNRSADGDALVERIVAKVLRRRIGELPPEAIYKGGDTVGGTVSDRQDQMNGLDT
jgi:hypothetical protein